MQTSSIIFSRRPSEASRERLENLRIECDTAGSIPDFDLHTVVPISLQSMQHPVDET
jgi:hypothetical protein